MPKRKPSTRPEAYKHEEATRKNNPESGGGDTLSALPYARPREGG